MNKYDKLIRQKAGKENIVLSQRIINRIEKTLYSLPENNEFFSKKRVRVNFFVVGACVVLIFLIILPNCSPVYANALERIPIIGNVIRVVTVRNYFYSDDYHEMDIRVPQITSDNKEVSEYINKDVEDLTKVIVEQFEDDLKKIGDKGHSSVYVDYEVVTNSEQWFTLKLRVYQAAGSGNTYYKYYHIDKTKDRIVGLGDLSDNDEFFDVIECEIKRQMRQIMEEDPEKVYWVDDAKLGQDFVKLDDTHNFYWDENGNIVIVFDKYEVAPGYMGTPEFTINREIISDFLSYN